MTNVVDLRSDTVTQPTPAMRVAIANAVVGDDGFDADPTIHELEATYAALVGKPAAVFVPSGVMANQIAIRIHTNPGDVIVTGPKAHVVAFELGASARNSAVQFATVTDDGGFLNLEEVNDVIDAEADHQPAVGLVVVENTNMYLGGLPYPLEHLKALAASVTKPIHMDGARLFNAAVATGVSPANYAEHATTVMSCLSKGLCAPVGSLLAGSADLIDRGRVERKRLGGSMRQAGFLAAAGLVALRDQVDRLAEDHAKARRLAEAVAEIFPEAGFSPEDAPTNIVALNVANARELVTKLEQHGVLAGTVGPTRLRFVTHADVTNDGVTQAIDALAKVR